MLSQLRNILRCAGWSFRATIDSPSKRAVRPGESVVLSGIVRNNGVRIGTAYTRFLVVDSYEREHLLFDSDQDLPENERNTLRLVDMSVGAQHNVACKWQVPAHVTAKHLDIRIETWNPHRLFKGPRGYKFHDTGWKGGIEVLSSLSSVPPSKTFISYSWDSASHQKWIRQFVEELEKHGIQTIVDQNDLFPGEEATAFMERGIAESRITVLVCSENYTRKADSRESGGVGFETIISSHEYLLRTPEERGRFIPIVRDNNLPKGRKLPRYLGSSIYVDMSGSDWRADPMLRLVDAIRRRMSTPK